MLSASMSAWTWLVSIWVQQDILCNCNALSERNLHPAMAALMAVAPHAKPPVHQLTSAPTLPPLLLADPQAGSLWEPPPSTSSSDQLLLPLLLPPKPLKLQQQQLQPAQQLPLARLHHQQEM
jgi:hypothetical protein